MGTRRRIVIVEDQTLVRQALKVVLELDPGYEVVGEASDGFEAIRRVDELKPDLVILDLSMPKAEGFELLRVIKEDAGGPLVLVVTGHREEEFVLRAFQGGADGYLLKEQCLDALVHGIETVLGGQRYLSPELSGLVIEGFVRSGVHPSLRSPMGMLSSREREILKLVAEGRSRRQIADIKCISAKTVDKHRENLMRKLDRHTVADLTAYAIEKGLVRR